MRLAADSCLFYAASGNEIGSGALAAAQCRGVVATRVAGTRRFAGKRCKTHLDGAWIADNAGLSARHSRLVPRRVITLFTAHMVLFPRIRRIRRIPRNRRIPGVSACVRPGAALRLPLACLLGGLLACSPRYDWRTVQSNDAGFVALYPGKPSTASREVTIAGHRYPMTMEASRVDDTLFAVGVVTLPADDATLRAQALDAMQAGLVANLGTQPAGPPQVRPVTVMSAQQPASALAGLEVKASGVSPQDNTPRRLSAWLVGSGSKVYQAVVLEAGDAARDARQAEQVEQFLSGFHPF
jgi:hypothetical protein